MGVFSRVGNVFGIGTFQLIAFSPEAVVFQRKVVDKFFALDADVHFQQIAGVHVVDVFVDIHAGFADFVLFAHEINAVIAPVQIQVDELRRTRRLL